MGREGEALPDMWVCARMETMEIPETIICVDCGQEARRLTLPPEEGWEIGDSVAYRCTGCNDRWDLVVADDTAEANFTSYASEYRAILEERRLEDPREPSSPQGFEGQARGL